MFLCFEFNPFIFSSEDMNIALHSYYIYFFLILILVNYIFINNTQIDNNFFNLDLIFKFIILLLKTPNFFLGYLIIIFKKIYLYLIHFKYKFFFLTSAIVIKKYLKQISLLWRPLFKKTSYFGFYRSNRSKWIK